MMKIKYYSVENSRYLGGWNMDDEVAAAFQEEETLQRRRWETPRNDCLRRE